MSLVDLEIVGPGGKNDDDGARLTKAIQQALTSHKAGIKLEPGTYKLKTPLQYITHEPDARGVVIEGSGPETVLECMVANDYAIKLFGRRYFDKDLGKELYQRRSSIRNLTITVPPDVISKMEEIEKKEEKLEENELFGKPSLFNNLVSYNGLRATAIYGLKIEAVRFHRLTGNAMQIGSRSLIPPGKEKAVSDYSAVIDMELDHVHVDGCLGWALDTMIDPDSLKGNAPIYNLVVRGGQYTYNRRGGIRGTFIGAVFDAVNFSINGSHNRSGQGCNLVLVNDGFTVSYAVSVRGCSFDTAWDSHVLIEEAYACEFRVNTYVGHSSFGGFSKTPRPLRNTVIGKMTTGVRYISDEEYKAIAPPQSWHIRAGFRAFVQPDSEAIWVRNIVFDSENIIGNYFADFVAYDFVKAYHVDVLRCRFINRVPTNPPSYAYMFRSNGARSDPNNQNLNLRLEFDGTPIDITKNQLPPPLSPPYVWRP